MLTLDNENDAGSEDEEPDFSDPEDFVDDITDEGIFSIIISIICFHHLYTDLAKIFTIAAWNRPLILFEANQILLH